MYTFKPNTLHINIRNSNYQFIFLRVIYYMTIFFIGVTHFEDVCYLLCPHMMKDKGISLATPDSDDYKMINYLTQLWTDFAKTGYRRFNVFIHILHAYSKHCILIIHVNFMYMKINVNLI